tara:strand:+ start:174 stop:314 length:141 start_codon:yes stop_codon:yes gene_type:complete
MYTIYSTHQNDKCQPLLKKYNRIPTKIVGIHEYLKISRKEDDIYES